MCQINNKRLKFSGDLKVYKVLVDDGESLKAPYHMEYAYTLGKTHKEEPSKTHFFYTKPTAPAIIDEKYFHSFIRYEDAKNETVMRKSRVVVECTIPEGTEVYQGEWQTSEGRYVPTVASKTIIPNKIIF